MHFIRLVSCALLVQLGCSDDPVSYSAPVGINLKAKSADTVNAVVTDEKGITTESGNPYGAFVADAETALGGADPSRIEVASVALLLGGGSAGVAALGEIFDGTVDVQFQMNDSNNSYPVADVDVDAAVGAGPVDLAVSFDSGQVQGDDYTRLLGGSFKVVLRGPAATGFTTKGADADLQLTFDFEAFE